MQCDWRSLWEEVIRHDKRWHICHKRNSKRTFFLKSFIMPSPLCAMLTRKNTSKALLSQMKTIENDIIFTPGQNYNNFRAFQPYSTWEQYFANEKWYLFGMKWNGIMNKLFRWSRRSCERREMAIWDIHEMKLNQNVIRCFLRALVGCG